MALPDDSAADPATSRPADSGPAPGAPYGPLFPPTQWSVIRQLQGSDSALRRAALQKVCLRYWKPVYAWLRARGSSREDAEDLAQDFFARLIAGDWLAEVDPDKGRLRSFLLVALKRHASNAWVREKAQKRGGRAVMVPIDAGAAESAWQSLLSHDASPDQIFDRHWALQLLERVMEELREQYAKAGKADVFDELRDAISGAPDSHSYAHSAATLGMSEGAVKVAAYRLRERYREHLRTTVAETVESPEAVTEEIDWLFRVFR